MKHKFYFGLLLIFFSLNTNLFAQNFWVPDSNFRAKLKQACPTCFTAQDSLITNGSGIQNVHTLNVGSSNINSLEGIQYFTTLNYLYCNSNQLSSLPALPASLEKLTCNTNQLTSLPALPVTLLELDCSNNQLTSLLALPASLIYLACNNNQLTSLPLLPASLRDLYCNYNQLTNLPLLHASLQVLYCSYNQLTSLPALPTSLAYLYCGDNQLSSLPALPASLYDLTCHKNQLTSLPTLPSQLEYLYCPFNQLTSLPSLPLSLIELICYQNQLTNLPLLPLTLTDLLCHQNQLTILPELPSSLVAFYCYNNQLTGLPRIPGKIIRLRCENNPITCFPEISPRLPLSLPWQNINIQNTLINCIPNQGTFPDSVVQSSQTLPLCSPATKGCNYNYTNGHVFIDANGNGSKDSLEQGLQIPVYYSGNSGVFPDSSGFFNAASDTGNINFQVSVPHYYLATTPSVQTIHVVSGIVDTLYFGFQAIPNINDLKVDFISIGFLRPGFNSNYQLHYQNIGTDSLINVKLKFLKPSQLVNLSAIPAASLASGDTLIWNIASLIPSQQGDVVIGNSVFANAVLGDTARAYAWIEPLVGDTTPLNNSSISTNIIRGAYDPNDKSVSINSVLPNSTDNLEYTIRFQNTGTDTAFTVTLIDKLSALLDISSMQMISASHNYELSIVNGFAKWIFKNILLPDSNTNELESHGFVKFKIKPLPGLTVTDSIQNKADIYFDYNVAVTTNTIVVNVVNPLQVQELKETELQIFPNSVQDILRIVNQQKGALGKIELINASGNLLETKTITSSTYTWNLQHLPAGIYILKGLGWGQKVVKE